MLSVNDLIVDIRDLPTEIQIQAYKQRMIPYVSNLQYLTPAIFLN